MIDKKLLELIQALKIKNDLDEFPLPSRYCFIHDKKVLFINKIRKNYVIFASPQCKLSFIDSQAVFNVVFSSNDFEEVRNKFLKLIKEI